MRKIEVAFTSLLLTALISSVIVVSVLGGSIHKDMSSWTNYAFKGTDSFYDDEYVVAYEAASTAMLVVSVKNDFGARINVSAVGISFDWQKPEGGWYNSTQASKESPVALEDGETVYLTVNFTVPSVDVAQEVLHDYTVYVEHVNATGDLERQNANRTYFEPDLPYFVVYSANQASSVQMDQIIGGIVRAAPTWNTTKTELLWQRAMNESSTADYYYALGDFSQAVVHYTKTLGLIDEAFTYEETKGETLKDAQIGALEAQVKLAEAWANFANGLSSMWTLIGIALVLFAFGYIIRGLAALRKTTAPQ